MKEKLITLWGRLKSYFPTVLPRTQDEFEEFMSAVCEPYGLPDTINSRFAVGNMIMHLPPVCYRKSRHYFASAIMKLQANEIAYDLLEKIRADQTAKQKAEQEAAATKATEAAPDGSQK